MKAAVIEKASLLKKARYYFTKFPKINSNSRKPQVSAPLLGEVSEILFILGEKKICKSE